MTKKNYEKIAAVLREHHREIPPIAFAHIRNTLADMFRADNPRFDERQFIEACR